MDEQLEVKTETTNTETKSDEQRIASFLWALLDKPKEFETTEVRDYWKRELRECMNTAEYDRVQFKRFLEWVLGMNQYSAEYMRTAKDPVKTLKKNLPNLLRMYKAYLKGLEALERSRNKLKKKDLPKYRQDSGKREILKGDI